MVEIDPYYAQGYRTPENEKELVDIFVKWWTEDSKLLPRRVASFEKGTLRMTRPVCFVFTLIA